jgi:hypothetical protein
MRLLCPPRCLVPPRSDAAAVLGVFAGVSAIGKLVRGHSHSSVSSLSAEPAAREEAEAEVELELGSRPMPADGDAIVIRDVTPADADTLAAIAVAAWRPIRRRQVKELGAPPPTPHPPYHSRPCTLFSNAESR